MNLHVQYILFKELVFLVFCTRDELSEVSNFNFITSRLEAWSFSGLV